MEFTFDLATDLYNRTDYFPVDFNLAWQWLGYSRKDSAKAALLSAGFEEGSDFQISLGSDNHAITASLSPQERASRSRVEQIFLTVDCFKSWGMIAGTDQGKQVRKYFITCEKELKRTQLQALPSSGSCQEQTITLLQDELQAIQSDLDRVATEIANLRAHQTNLKKQYEIKSFLIDGLKDNLETSLNLQISLGSDNHAITGNIEQKPYPIQSNINLHPQFDQIRKTVLHVLHLHPNTWHYVSSICVSTRLVGYDRTTVERVVNALFLKGQVDKKRRPNGSRDMYKAH